MATASVKASRPMPLPLLGGLAVLVVFGLVAWIMQLTQGMSITGVTQNMAWGVYIATFFLLAGASSGLVILAALGDLGVATAFKPLRARALLAAVAGYIAAGFAILMDIGHPERVFRFFLSPNFGSMFVWDFYALAAGVVVAALYYYLGAKGKTLPIVAGLVAFAVVVVEGWILSVTAGRPYWHSALVPVLFVVEGFIVALALVLVFTQAGDAANRAARRSLLWLLPTFVALTLFELVTVTYGGDPDAKAAAALVVSGSLAIPFWAQLLLGVAGPWALLLWGGSGRAVAIAAAVLAACGVWLAKMVLLVAGQALPFMQAQAGYAPSLVEAAGAVGVAALAGLLYMLGSRLLPSKAA